MTPNVQSRMWIRIGLDLCAFAAVAALTLLVMGVVRAQVPPSLTPQPVPPTTSIMLTPDQIDAIVRSQTVDYLRYILIQKCNGICGPTDRFPPKAP